MNLLGVCAHVRLSIEGETAANVGSVQLLVHRGHVPLQVVPPVRLIAALGEPALERLVISVAVAVGRGQLLSAIAVRMAWRGEKCLEVGG